MPSPSESVNRSLWRVVQAPVIALALAGCGGGATEVSPVPLTTVTRVDVQVAGDSLLLGDTLQVVVRAVNRVGDVIPATTIAWSSADSATLSVSSTGVIRARNVGTVRLDVLADGVVGSRTVRVVSRPVRVALSAPDSVELIDQISLSASVTTAAGVALPEVAPRFASTDTAIARIQASGLSTASVQAVRTGVTDLLAIIGRDTTRRRMVVRVTPLRTLALTIVPRVVAVGDSVPFSITAIDSLGRVVPAGAIVTSVEPAGLLTMRDGRLLAVSFGRAIVSVTNGVRTARDTIIVQAPSEFALEIVDGNPQFPLPLKIRSSMERVSAKWRTVIRSSPPGEFVRLAVGDCRNAVPVAQFISGVRVLIKLDTLPARIAGQGGPCAIRSNGLPLLGTISLNILNYNSLSDRKLDDLIQHEVGHVLGLGTIWGRGILAPLVEGDTSAVDPIFVGSRAVAAFPKLGQSARFAGRVVPLQLNVRGHWRVDAFAGEVMAPALVNGEQPTSAVTVAALADIGWNVELEAYEEYSLPEAVLQPAVTARVFGARVVNSAMSIDGDVLFPEIMILPGRTVRLDPATGRPRYK